jgi:hypothetical protein
MAKKLIRLAQMQSGLSGRRPEWVILLGGTVSQDNTCICISAGSEELGIGLLWVIPSPAITLDNFET